MHSPGAECPTAGESSWGGLSPLPRLPHQHCSGHKLQKEKGRSYYPKLETLGHISSPPKKCCACLPPALQPPVVLWRVSNPAHVLCVDLRASCPAIPLHSKKKKTQYVLHRKIWNCETHEQRLHWLPRVLQYTAEGICLSLQISASSTAAWKTPPNEAGFKQTTCMGICFCFFFPLGTQYFSQNIKGSGKGFQLTAGRSQLVHELL